jgi:hypothetical protein
VTCVISHGDGYFEENSLAAAQDDSGNKNSIQAVGSTVTYLERYTLKAALGLAVATDDDAQSVGGNELVSPEQLLELENLVERTGSDMVKFCKHMKVPDLDNLPAARFKEAFDQLELTRKANERANNPAD